MENVRLLTIIFGGLILVLRLPGVIWPASVKDIHEKIVDMKSGSARIVSVLMFILSFIIFITILKSFRAVEVLAIIFGLVVFSAAVIFLFIDEIRSLPKKILQMSPLVYRILSAVGCAIGAAILIVGIVG